MGTPIRHQLLGAFRVVGRATRRAVRGCPSQGRCINVEWPLVFPVVLDDLQFDRRPYDPWLAYRQSKTAIVLFAVEATRRWAADGITANAVMPGGIRTNLQQHQSGPEWEEIDRNYDWKTVQEGAATSVFVATSPLLLGIGGRYFEDCQQAPVVDPQIGDERQAGVAAYALDPKTAKQLWDVSLQLLDR
jgi:NAD(P)-dependent dehydrogenase (short-subunit alcohol dehydrogenase family)